MSAACSQAAAAVGNGVSAALQAVDCVAADTTAAAFGRMFAPGGALIGVLTILLTLYVGYFAINLLLGRASLGVRALTPRMLTIGLVLTFVTSWVAYSTVVWNLAVGGPDQIATIVTGSQGSATQVFSQKIDIVFAALEQASPGQAQGKDISAFSPEGMMWLGAMLFMLGTVGVLVTARIALAVLITVGPIFVVLALFPGTRGLFTGWLKGLVMLALAPLLAVLGGSIMLELAVPIISVLAQSPGQIDSQAAMAFFLVGAVHMALMVFVLKVAATMVSGWRVFGLAPDAAAPQAPVREVAATSPTVRMAEPTTGSDATRLPSHDRRIPNVAFATGPAANDAAHAGAVRETRILAQTAGHAPSTGEAGVTSSQHRARGIGSRFRSPQPRLSEKIR